MLGVNESFLPGSLGDVSECESYGSSEGPSSHQGNRKLPVGPTRSSLGVLECRPHLPVTRSSSGPDQQGQRRSGSSLHQGLSSQSGAISSDDLAARTGLSSCPLLKVRVGSLSPLHFSRPLRETHISHSTPSLFTCPSDQHTAQQSQQSSASQTGDRTDASRQRKSSTPDWQTERWHIWQILSKENSEALPETLVWHTGWLWTLVKIMF